MVNHLSGCRQLTALLLFVFLVSAAFLGWDCQGKSTQTFGADQSAEMQKEGQTAESGSASATIEIPKGTSITVRLLETVSNRSAGSGDRFDAEVANPVVVDGIPAIPERARVRGRIVAAKPSGRLQKLGYVSMVLDSIQTADGNWVNINTDAISRSGGSHKKRNLTLIGGGAGLGAIIGGIAGGGKGAAIGAAAGAGAGTAGAYATGEKDISFQAESKLTFRLEEALVLAR